MRDTESEEEEEDEFSGLIVKQLKAECRRRHLPVSGRRKQLLARLRAYEVGLLLPIHHCPPLYSLLRFPTSVGTRRPIMRGRS